MDKTRGEREAQHKRWMKMNFARRRRDWKIIKLHHICHQMNVYRLQLMRFPRFHPRLLVSWFVTEAMSSSQHSQNEFRLRLSSWRRSVLFTGKSRSREAQWERSLPRNVKKNYALSAIVEGICPWKLIWIDSCLGAIRKRRHSKGKKGKGGHQKATSFPNSPLMKNVQKINKKALKTSASDINFRHYCKESNLFFTNFLKFLNLVTFSTCKVNR